jgi:major type 1 subunit fimbrin (pilin)
MRITMKFTRSGVLAIAIATAFAMPAVSHAADGTITINGQITAQTCTISGNGGGKDFTVILPVVSASALAIAGATAGLTPFSIALTACTPNSGNVSTYFEMGANVNTVTGQLKNTGVTNVEVGLLNASASLITVGAAVGAQNSPSVAITSGSATLSYFAEYVATGVVAGPGVVSTSVMYSLIYQ